MTLGRVRVRAVAAVTITGALALALSACSTQQAPRAAAGLTTADFGKTVTAAENAAGGVRLQMTISTDQKTAVTVKAEAAEQNGKLVLAEQLRAGGTTENVFYANDEFYVDLGAATLNRYLVLGVSAAGPSSSVEQLAAAKAMFDRSSIAAFADNTGGVSYAQVSGQDTELDGTAVTPYTVGVTTTQLAGFAAESAILGPKVIAQLPGETTVDYWIGSDHLPRRAVSIVNGIETDVDYQWGGLSSVALPPKSAQLTVAQLAKLLKGKAPRAAGSSTA